MGLFKQFATFLAVLAAVPALVNMVFQPTFAVHQVGGIVVTGASSGIGRHAAGALAGLGYTVFAGVRKERDAEQLRADFPGIRPVVLDVASQASIDAAKAEVTTVLDSLGLPLVALVNNAGVQKDLPVELQSPVMDRFTFDVNVLGLLDVTRAFVPVLRATGDGARIVNVGSLAGLTGMPGGATYVGSKFAVEGISDSLRMELKEFGVSVSLIQPGYIHTQMGAKAYEKTDYGVTLQELKLYKTVFEGAFVIDKAETTPEKASTPSLSSTPAIIDAIRSPKPRTRYPVAGAGGFPSWAIALIKTVSPDRLMDYLIMMDYA